MLKQLSIVFCKDGRYRFIGRIYEEEMKAFSAIGFDFYYEALSRMGDYGYSLPADNKNIKQEV